MANRVGAPNAPGPSGLFTAFLLTGLTVAGILIHGYHFGFDDQCVYLPAIKKNFDPSLYPFDAGFFLLQTRLGCYVNAVAASIRFTRLSVDWALLLWHFATVFLFLTGCLRISRLCFRTTAGVYGSLLLVTALLTLPVAGTFIKLCEPYQHPRVLANGCVLLALESVLQKRPRAAVWLLLAFLVHPTIALIGSWHLAVQAWPARTWKASHSPVQACAALAAAGLAIQPLERWLADPSDSAWREALFGRSYLFPTRWTWYELLGAFAPLLILLLYARFARRHGLELLRRIASRLAFSGSIGVAAGLVVGFTPALLPLIPLELMRTLHLVYLLMVLFAGGLCGEFLPRSWKLVGAALLVPLAAGMFLAQRAELSASPHIEWPGITPANDWRQAFAWIRRQTPPNALFAMNPDVLGLPGENEHGFRALAERSQLAEAAKDRAVSRNIPALAWEWREEVRAQRGIEDFDAARLTDLRNRYGVTWLLLRSSAGRAASLPALDCPYENQTLRVCRAP